MHALDILALRDDREARHPRGIKTEELLAANTIYFMKIHCILPSSADQYVYLVIVAFIINKSIACNPLRDVGECTDIRQTQRLQKSVSWLII